MALVGPTEKQLQLICLKTGHVECHLATLKRFMYLNHPTLSYNYDYLYPLFLRGCKCDPSRAREKLQEFIAARTTCHGLYGNWDVRDAGVRAASNFIECVPLPRLTDDGYRVVIHRTSENDDVTLRDVARYLLMLADLRMHQEHDIAGDIYVFDIKNLRASFLMKLVNPLLKKIFGIIERAYPQRLKQIHIVNAPGYIYNVLTMVKSLMKKKMRDRFVVHVGENTLGEYMPTRILPSEYGGDAASIADMANYWTDRLANNSEEELVRFDDCARSDYKSISKEDEYGADGLFKTLQID